MKSAHTPHVPHHPGLHLGPIEIEWNSLVVPLVTLAMILVVAFLASAPPVEVPIWPFVDPSLAP